MSTAPATELLHPLLTIGKPNTPLLFLDTLFWRRLLEDPAAAGDAQLLRAACARGFVQPVITDLVKAELTRRRLLPRAQDLCGSALLALPMDRIALNQALRSLVGYLGYKTHVPLRWELMISEPPVDTRAEGLGSWVADFVAALNADRDDRPATTKETWTSGITVIERHVWRLALERYRDLLPPPAGADPRTFDRYFSTDYFLDIPVVTLKVYYLGDILGQRPLKRQDIIDVYSIGELLPYTSLYLMDKDQHDRLHKLMQRYPPLFGNLGNLTAVRSHWPHSEDPWQAFRAFLSQP